MLVNIPRNERARAIGLALRAQTRFEAALSLRLRKYLRALGDDVAKALQHENPQLIAILIRESEEPLERLLAAHYLAVGRYFGQHFLTRALNKGFAPARVKSAGTDFEELLIAWTRANAAAKVQKITKTTRKLIFSALDEGATDGLSLNETAKLIRNTTGGVIGRARSFVIARTETHAASQSASFQAATATRIPAMQKEWAAVNDQRTRDSHKEADGQRQTLDEKFEVGSSALDYPGDPSGEPEEVINCRCQQLYLTPEFDGL